MVAFQSGHSIRYSLARPSNVRPFEWMRPSARARAIIRINSNRFFLFGRKEKKKIKYEKNVAVAHGRKRMNIEQWHRFDMRPETATKSVLHDVTKLKIIIIYWLCLCALFMRRDSTVDSSAFTSFSRFCTFRFCSWLFYTRSTDHECSSRLH